MNEIKTAIAQLEAAFNEKKLSTSAVENIKTWLTQPYFGDYTPQVVQHIVDGKWAELEDAFWTTIPFGTGGRRGRMYPIGCNAINDRTIGETAQGLANYVKKQAAVSTARKSDKPLSCAIAYDTRHRSRQFAELCAEIMAAAGFTVFFLNGYRSTPELSFAVRYKHCDCGIIITASHNPPSDNAVKAYGPSGGQYCPPHDAASVKEMQQVTWINRVPFAEALADGRIVYCQDEVDAAFIRAVLSQSIKGPRNLKILYSPLHGVGASAVYPVLDEAGFREVEIFEPHAEPNGDFPNVPNHIANPENAAVFDTMIEHANRSGAELILATDPDCDRLGCAVRKSWDANAPWVTLTGNQIGALLVDFLLSSRQTAGTLSSQNYVVKTLVTTELIRHIADSYGVQTAGNLHVGFKWIGAEIDKRGPENFILGAEESYGFLVGTHVRDKDAAVASLLTAEMAAKLKLEGKTLYQQLLELMQRHGTFTETQINVQMPGEKGMDDMRALMTKLRTAPPEKLGDMTVVNMRDYLNGTQKSVAGVVLPLEAPKGDMVILDFERKGNYIAIRPSGTEPKVKIYLFAYDPPHTNEGIETVRSAQLLRLKAVGDDFRRYAGV